MPPGHRLRSIPLPPVVLIKIGDAYFVQDGHHPISVARAFGDKAIEAMITAYELSPRAAQRAPAMAGG